MSFLPRGRLGKSQSASRRTGRVTRRPLYGWLLRLEALEDRYLPSGTPHLLKDINTNSADAHVTDILSVNGVAYFSATDGTHGFQLWRSDGTASGAQMVTDITDFSGGSLYPEDLTNVGGTLFFSATDPTQSGRHLWRSDGTAGGTQLVGDVNFPGYLTNVSGTLFFAGGDFHGFELWRSDGTAAGTQIVKDIFPVSFYSSNPSDLTNVSGTLFFEANDGTHGYELWRSDGTASGTQLVDDINPGSANSYPTDLTNVGRTLFFSADDGTHGNELWRSNGTAAGTQLVKDINPDSSGSIPPGGFYTVSSLTEFMTNVGGTLFFSANDGTHGVELWRSNGTAGGTQLVSDINPGSANSYPKYLTNVGGTLFFSANDGTHGAELWSSNGMTSGTQMVADVNPGSGGSSPKYLTNVGGTLFFQADDGTNGNELWRSNGTAGGTELIDDINPGNNNSYPTDLTNVGGTLFFSADDGTHGNELWRSDGTATGTSQIAQIRSFNLGSYPSDLLPIGGTLFFVPDLGISSADELWRSDGTAGGTQLVDDIYPGSDFFPPSELTNVSGTLFFAANDPTHGDELWRSDGTAGGTYLVKDIFPGIDYYGIPNFSSPQDLTNVGGTLFFWAYDGNGVEVWRSDGTADGTQPVEALSFPVLTPPDLTNVAGTLFFVRDGETDGYELWRSDGTAAGTQMVKDINPGIDAYGFPNSSPPTDLTNVGGTLFFSADDGTHGFELWRSDGTTSGTQMVTDINPGLTGLSPTDLTNVGGTLFFAANDGTHGVELWRSDGTAGGTQMVADVNPGSSGSSPTDLTNVGGTLFFAASDGIHVVELWRSDGTAAGTQMVADINPGSSGSSPTDLTNVGGTLFFAANDGTHGVELWRSNGTAAGTQLYDINPGSSGSYPTDLTSTGGTLFFSANDGTHGVEPWILAPTLSSQTTINFSPASPVTFGTQVTFSTTVAPGTTSGTPTGTVAFKDGAATLASDVAINGSGIATFSIGSLGAGTQTITVVYSGDTTFQSSTSSNAVLVISQAGTGTMLSPASPSVVNGQAISFTATVTNTSGTGVKPAGTVMFEDNGVQFGPTVNLGGGAGSTTTVTSASTSFTVASGANTITAVYTNTDGNFAGSTSAGMTVTAVTDGTSTAVQSSDKGSAVIGETVTLTATVSPTAPGTLTPNGSVVFSIDGTPGNSIPLTNGQATTTLSIAAGTVGAAHTVTAAYTPANTNFSASDSTGSPFSEMVSQASTTTTESSSANPSLLNAAVTITATVAVVAPGAGSPTGSVDFTQGAKDLTPGGVVVTSGQATFSISTLALGNNTITATYSGDSNFSTSSGNITQHVKDSSTTTVTFSPASAPRFFGNPVTLTATVAPASSPGTPSGTVTFKDGSTTLASNVTLNASSVATLSTSALSVGNHTITAAYGGETNFQGSTSGAAVVSITGAVTGTTLSQRGAVVLTASFSSHPTTITVKAIPGKINAGTRLTFPGPVVLQITQTALQGATTIHVSALTSGGGAAGASAAVNFSSGISVYGQANVRITATVKALPGQGSGSPTTGGVVFTDILLTNTGNVTLKSTAAAHTTSLAVQPLPGALQGGEVLRFVVSGNNVNVTVSSANVVVVLTAAVAGATSLNVQPIQQALTKGATLTFGSATVTLTAAAAAGASTLSVSAIPAAIAKGTASNAANAGDTTIHVNDIGATAIPSRTTATRDNHGNPLFLLGARKTRTIGLVEVGAGGEAVLNESGSPALVLPGIFTAYKNNGQIANLPLDDFIVARYVNGLSGGPSDPRFTPSPNPSAAFPEVISQDPTTTTIAASESGAPPFHFGMTATLTATVKSLGGSLVGPFGTVTFMDSYTVGGVTTNTTLGTVTLPSLASGVTSATVTLKTSTLAQAVHTLTAVYNGDNTAPFPLPTSFPFRDEWLGSQATGVINVQPSTSTGTLSANPTNNSTFGSSVTFVDSLQSGTSVPPPGGAPSTAQIALDQLFSSTTGTAQHDTPRRLAGTLGKTHSSDDWLTGDF
jgi:ELWxxDGT repeat protein